MLDLYRDKAKEILQLAGLGIFFIIGSIPFGLVPLANIANIAWDSRDWQPVPATVVDTAYERQRSRSDYVYIHYRYEFAGKPYDSERIGLATALGSSGTWRQKSYAAAVAAQEARRPLTAWVDPRRPERAVLDRDVHLGSLGFSALFACACIGTGTFLLLYAQRQLHHLGGLAEAIRLLRK